KDRGVSLLLGGKRTLKIGDTMSSMLVPFIKLETEEDFENLADIVERIWDFWNDHAHDHERVSEFIDRVGLGVFLDGVGLEPDPRMVAQPRTSTYIKFEELSPSRFGGEQEQNPPTWEREPETVES
ncbi:MAG: hypothetical protein GY792_36425, partial [Gammaproteobacteria bacterium]|nr:hypothetical protein [Gammaproteobacteria bacterium]